MCGDQLHGRGYISRTDIEDHTGVMNDLKGEGGVYSDICVYMGGVCICTESALYIRYGYSRCYMDWVVLGEGVGGYNGEIYLWWVRLMCM